jgi:hypothetical protein
MLLHIDMHLGVFFAVLAPAEGSGVTSVAKVCDWAEVISGTGATGI